MSSLRPVLDMQKHKLTNHHWRSLALEQDVVLVLAWGWDEGSVLGEVMGELVLLACSHHNHCNRSMNIFPRCRLELCCTIPCTVFPLGNQSNLYTKTIHTFVPSPQAVCCTSHCMILVLALVTVGVSVSVSVSVVDLASAMVRKAEAVAGCHHWQQS